MPVQNRGIVYEIKGDPLIFASSVHRRYPHLEKKTKIIEVIIKRKLF